MTLSLPAVQCPSCLLLPLSSYASVSVDMGLILRSSFLIHRPSACLLLMLLLLLLIGGRSQGLPQPQRVFMSVLWFVVAPDGARL